MPGTLYVNVRTNALVETFGEGRIEFIVATVKDDGTHGRRRKVRASFFHDGYLASDGQTHSSGYVPVNSLPGDHPRAMKTEMTYMELLDALPGMSPDELARVIAEQQKILSEAKTLVERAKDIAKGRRAETGTGTEVHGGIALVYTSGTKFDGPTAKRNLTAEEYSKILLPKPDAALARALFKTEPDKLDLCLKDNGLTLTVRQATEEDYERADNDGTPASADEDFSYAL